MQNPSTTPQKQPTSLKAHLAHLQTLKQRGRIELIMGTMFAGKSTELLIRLRRQEAAKKRVLRVKFTADQRYSHAGMIATHNGQSCEAVPVTLLAELGDQWRAYDVIGIDEGQFFNDVSQFAEMAANAGKIVIISSLQGTFYRTTWKNVTELIPLCEEVVKLSAICQLCKEKKASFTFRTASAENQKLIGGAEMYMPLCRLCHIVKSSESEVQYMGDPEHIKVNVELNNKPASDSATTSATSSEEGLSHEAVQAE